MREHTTAANPSSLTLVNVPHGFVNALPFFLLGESGREVTRSSAHRSIGHSCLGMTDFFPEIRADLPVSDADGAVD